MIHCMHSHLIPLGSVWGKGTMEQGLIWPGTSPISQRRACMKSLPRLLLLAIAGVFTCAVELPAAVTEVRGSAETSIIQYLGVAPIQADFSQEIVPLTKPELPATAQADLDRLDSEGSTSAAAQAVARLESPAIGGSPNDVGLDLSAFSDDDLTGWRLESIVNETRVMNLSALELGATGTNSPATSVTSKVVISGVMIIAALDTATDLTGVEVNLTVSVTQSRPGRSPATVLSGDVALIGHPNGQVSVDRASGAFEGVSLPVIDFNGGSESVALAKAVLLTGLTLPYEYGISAGEEFKLDLSVRSQVITRPGGIGAAATFGVPQGALGVVFEKVKHDNRGRDLAEVISQHVDTTGQAYVDNPAPLPFFSICGASSVELPLLAVGMGIMTMARSRRRRLSRSG
jgi:hypothetical protein